MTQRRMSKKQLVIAEMYAQCKSRGEFIFNNDELRAVCSKIGFRNTFDVTKIDNSARLPQIMVDDDVFVVHLGGGQSRLRLKYFVRIPHFRGSTGGSPG